MKKYFLTKNNQEVMVGDEITLIKSVNTSYGGGKVLIRVKVTEDILEKLVKDGFVKVEEFDEAEGMFERLKPYIMEIAKKSHIVFPTACGMLDVVLETSPTAHLQLLIETVAKVKNRGKKPGKDTWYLDPLISYKPVQIMGNPMAATVFYEAGDALEAHRTLLPFIKDILDGE